MTKKDIILDNSHKEKILERSIYGILMGISDGIPGYSGGTTLSLINFFEILIDKIKGVFYPFNFKKAWRNILWLLPFIFFWVISLVAFSIFGDLMATGEIFRKTIIKNHNLSIVLIFMFTFFSIFSIPLFIKSNKVNLFELENKRLKIKKRNWLNILFFSIGFCLIITIGLVVFFVNGGVNFNGTSNIEKISYSWTNLLMIVISMFLAGFSMLIPGISGSMVLYLFNTYDDVFWTILQNPISNIGYVFICAISAILGLLSSILLTSFILKRWKDNYYSFCFGMVCSSPITILLSGKRYYIDLVNDYNICVPLIIISLIIVIFINIAIYIHIKNKERSNDEFKQINMKQL